MLSRILSERPRENHKHSIEKPASGHPRRVYTMGQLTRNEVFTLAVQRYSDTVYRTAVHNCRCTADAEDVVQDVFTIVWNSREKLNTHQSFSAYLFTVTRNRALNELRNARTIEQIDAISDGQQALFSEDDIESSFILKEYETILQQAIDMLPEERRRIYRLSREEGMTYKDIEEYLGISHHTVQSHISSSVQFIRNYVLQHANVSLLAVSTLLLNKL